MRSHAARLVVSLMGIVLIGACAGQQAQTPVADTAAVTAAVDSVNKAFLAAVLARDTTAIANFYSDDARLLPANAPRANGREAIGHAWAGFLGMPNLQLSFTSSEVIVSQAGDLAIDIGAYDMKWNDAKGKPMNDVGKYVTVMKKTDQGWKIIVDTFNSDMAMQST